MTDTEKLIRALRCTGKINCDMNCFNCEFHQLKHDIMSLDLLATDDLLKLADLINLAADKIEELSSGKEEKNEGTGCELCNGTLLCPEYNDCWHCEGQCDAYKPQYNYCPECGKLLKGGGT